MPQPIKNVVREFQPTANWLGTAGDSALAWFMRLLNALTRQHLNYVLASPALGIGTTTQRVRTNAAVPYAAAGILRTALASTDNFWTLPATVIPPGSIGAFILYVSGAGAASVVAVPAVLGNNPDLLNWPENADDLACFGFITVATNASTTFTGNTTALGAAGVTTTYVNGFPPQWVPRLQAIF